MRPSRALPTVVTISALMLAGMSGVASASDSPTEADGGSIVTDYAYPGASAIMEDQNVKLIAGDGHIVLADCATPPVDDIGVVEVWTTELIGPDGAGLVCFEVTGPVGWLTMAVPGVYEIRGDGQARGTGHTMTADVTTDSGVHTTVDVNPSGSTQVGLGADPDNDPTTLVELRVDDPLPAGDTGQYPFVAKIDVDGRGCTGVLVQVQYVATSKACFAANGDVTAGPAPASATAVIGRPDAGRSSGVEVAITELVPRADRDLVLAKLATPVGDIAPAKLATTPPEVGDTLVGAGLGRTATDWAIGTLHTGTFTVAAVAGTTVDLTRAAGTATSTCAGDAGGPALRSTTDGQVELLAIHTASWQTGCFGVTETRDLAVETRVDDLGAWLAEYAPPPPPAYYPLGDTNGDGRSDAIMLYHWNDGAIGLFTSHTDPNGNFDAFTLGSTVPAASWDWNAFKTITGDFNGDHRTDLAIMYHHTSGEIWMMTALANQDGTHGTFQTSLQVPAAAGWDFNAIRLYAGDTNGDGRSDAIMLYHWNDGAIGLFTSHTDPNGNFDAFTLGSTVPAASWDWNAFKTITGDFNGDHRTDLAIMYHHTSGEIWMMTALANQDGTHGTFQTSLQVPAAAGWDFNAIRLY